MSSNTDSGADLRRRRPASSGLKRLGALPLALAAGACCSAPPTNAQLLNASFRSPEATLETFRLAWRCDEPDLQYRCLSSGLTEELHLSQLAWREARDKVLEESGLSALFVDRLKPAGPATVRGDEAWLEVESLGRRLRLCFVRESVGRVWAGGKLVSDEDVAWSSAVGSQEADGGPLVYGRMPSRAAPAEIDELRLSREWKLDRLLAP